MLTKVSFGMKIIFKYTLFSGIQIYMLFIN